jgi:hypothetical protein
MKDAGMRNCEIAAKLGICQNALGGLLHGRDSYRRKAGSYARLADEPRGVIGADAAEQVLHRETEPAPTRLVELHLSDADFARLIAAARADNQTPAATARIMVLGGLSLREAFAEGGG